MTNDFNDYHYSLGQYLGMTAAMTQVHMTPVLVCTLDVAN